MRKKIKVVARAARYGGGCFGFPDYTLGGCSTVDVLFFYFPANGSTNPDVF